MLIFSPFYRWENWGTRRLNTLAQFIQAVSGVSGFEPRKSDFNNFVLNHWLPLRVPERCQSWYITSSADNIQVFQVPEGKGLQKWPHKTSANLLKSWGTEKGDWSIQPYVIQSHEKFQKILQHLPSLPLGRSFVPNPCLCCFSRLPTISLFYHTANDPSESQFYSHQVHYPLPIEPPGFEPQVLPLTVSRKLEHVTYPPFRCLHLK